MKPLKSLYQWVLSWAESAYGTLVLFLVAFAESSFFPVPADPLLMALCLGKVKKSMYYVFMCTLGSVLGGVFGFMIGYFLWYTPGGELTGVANFFFRVIPGFTPEVFDNVGAQYDAHNFLVIFTAAFTPIPYKVFSITAGVFQINLPTFIILPPIFVIDKLALANGPESWSTTKSTPCCSVAFKTVSFQFLLEISMQKSA